MGIKVEEDKNEGMKKKEMADKDDALSESKGYVSYLVDPIGFVNQEDRAATNEDKLNEQDGQERNSENDILVEIKTRNKRILDHFYHYHLRSRILKDVRPLLTQVYYGYII